jgi:hypothetical protein
LIDARRRFRTGATGECAADLISRSEGAAAHALGAGLSVFFPACECRLPPLGLSLWRAEQESCRLDAGTLRVAPTRTRHRLSMLRFCPAGRSERGAYAVPAAPRLRAAREELPWVARPARAGALRAAPVGAVPAARPPAVAAGPSRAQAARAQAGQLAAAGPARVAWLAPAALAKAGARRSTLRPVAAGSPGRQAARLATVELSVPAAQVALAVAMLVV